MVFCPKQVESFIKHGKVWPIGRLMMSVYSMCSTVTMTHHAAALETYNNEFLKSEQLLCLLTAKKNRKALVNEF